MQQSGRNRGIRSVGAIVSAAVGLWLTGCAHEKDWELTEIGAEEESSEIEDADGGCSQPSPSSRRRVADLPATQDGGPHQVAHDVDGGATHVDEAIDGGDDDGELDEDECDDVPLSL